MLSILERKTRHYTDITERGRGWLRRRWTSDQCRINAECNDRQLIGNAHLLAGKSSVGRVIRSSSVVWPGKVPQVLASNLLPASLRVCLHSLACPRVSTPRSSRVRTWQLTGPGESTSRCQRRLRLRRERLQSRQSAGPMTWCTIARTNFTHSVAIYGDSFATSSQKSIAADSISNKTGFLTNYFRKKNTNNYINTRLTKKTFP